MIPDGPGGTNVITRVFIRERRRVTIRGDVALKVEAEAGLLRREADEPGEVRSLGS